MKLRSFLTATAAAATLLTLGLPTAHAQPKYKDEYRLSVVLGTAFPWGKGAEIWADKVREARMAASISSSTPAPRWCRVTRPVNSAPSARV